MANNHSMSVIMKIYIYVNNGNINGNTMWLMILMSIINVVMAGNVSIWLIQYNVAM